MTASGAVGKTIYLYKYSESLGFQAYSGEAFLIAGDVWMGKKGDYIFRVGKDTEEGISQDKSVWYLAPSECDAMIAIAHEMLGDAYDLTMRVKEIHKHVDFLHDKCSKLIEDI